MKALIIAMMLLISSSAYAQETIKVIGLKHTDAEAVTNTLKNVIETVNKDKTRSSVAVTNLVAIDKDDQDKARPSTEKMAESMFKRIDTDKNGSLSLKEFKAFYARIRSGRTSRGPQSSDRGRSDRSRSSRSRSDDKDSPKRFGPDKKDGLRGPPKGGDKKDK